MNVAVLFAVAGIGEPPVAAFEFTFERLLTWKRTQKSTHMIILLLLVSLPTLAESIPSWPPTERLYLSNVTEP